MKVYVAYSKHYPYLPLAVTDTQLELSKIMGVGRSVVCNGIRRSKRKGHTSSYYEVEVEMEGSEE